jgi:hypothetical protein
MPPIMNLGQCDDRESHGESISCEYSADILQLCRIIKCSAAEGYGMGRVGRNGHDFTTCITTGPQDLLLLLDLADERIADARKGVRLILQKST